MKIILKVYSRLAFCVAVMVTFSFISCKQESLESRISNLPELPPGLVENLDKATLSTKLSGTFDPPEPGEIVLPAMCCSSHITSYLEVSFPYTRCGPISNFIESQQEFVALMLRSGDNQDSEPTDIQAYQLTNFSELTEFNPNICFSGVGPWPAELVEETSCQGYARTYRLTVVVMGELKVFYWNGDISNHPEGISVVSCRRHHTLMTNCGISSCDCHSELCEDPVRCDCSDIW